MIKINLAKKRKGSGGGGTGTFTDLKSINFANFLASLRSNSNGDEGGKLIELNGPIPKILISLALCWLVGDIIDGYRKEQLAAVDQEIARIEKEKSAIQAKLDTVKGYESVKKKLEEDEVSIRTKLDVVNKLLENRSAPSKLMLQIAQSIPDEVWLSTLQATPTNVKISGATPGYNQVSDFIKALSSTSQFGEISLSGIQENVTTAKDQRFQTFELSANRRQDQ